MKKSHLFPTLALSVLVLLAACGKRDAAPASSDTPHGTVMLTVEAIRADDVLAVLKNSIPEDAYTEARAEWESARGNALDPTEEADLNDALARLRKEDAVDDIMAEIEPRLLEVREQLPLLLGIAQTVGHAGIANNDTLTDEQKVAANELLGAMGRWAGSRDLADPALARQAVTVAVEAGRKLDLETASDLQALEFEEMIKRLGVLLRANKDMLLVYGIDVDAMLDSVSAETLSEENDNATVRMRFRFLDTDQKIDIPMVRKDGRWLGRGVADIQVESEAGHEDEV